MRSLLLDGEAKTLWWLLAGLSPDLPVLPAVKRELLDYQMAALYYLAQQYDERPGAWMLEIGTGRGASGYMLSKAAPRARVISLTIDHDGAKQARDLWQRSHCANIAAVLEMSWNFLEQEPRDTWDLIFVDGDHNQIARDLLWFNRLRAGGLMIFHDYSPADSPRPSAICHAALDAMTDYLGRPFDVRIVDDTKIGMVGFYRREGESWS